eukprot:3466036-Prymnesium_polylepis.1
MIAGRMKSLVAPFCSRKSLSQPASSSPPPTCPSGEAATWGRRPRGWEGRPRGEGGHVGRAATWHASGEAACVQQCVWRAVWGVWYAACGVRCAVRGVRCARRAVRGARRAVCGVHGLRVARAHLEQIVADGLGVVLGLVDQLGLVEGDAAVLGHKFGVLELEGVAHLVTWGHVGSRGVTRGRVGA